MARTCPLHIQLPAIGTVAAALLVAGDVTTAPGRVMAGVADMEPAERHTHRESAEGQLVVYLQALAAASRSMPSELLVAQRQRTNLVAVRLPVSTRSIAKADHARLGEQMPGPRRALT